MLVLGFKDLILFLESDVTLTFSRRDLNPPCSATVPRVLERSFNF